MLKDFLIIGVFLVAAFVFGMIILLIASSVRPKKPNAEKLSTYECGVETTGSTWIRFKVSYFMYALVFLLFDVETVFLLPWAMKFKMLSLFALGEMFIFIGILIIGLFYAWKEGALEWK
ncbi:NADH-quinone oxidoreductase subunit A [Clostridium folliculivorans]|uniref:NADH-quinone oxidoreductase subunit A n=1 Tax=Clostridium folliculivorans TaxID=2886038 RepID=A0A9W5Y6U3_9CLOT|nr:NADH-quinone oxidoreductase subunit A [Clostridium folliculivorans]GKU27563.1 NADH-quinone oxidoreductase subunit A [Clostridium folliculivorans]